MTMVERTFTTRASADVAVAYLKDFTNAVEWDPGTVSCERTDGDGPVQVGATWRNVSHILGSDTELTYTLEALEPQRVVLVGRNKTATSTETITVRPHEGGSEITYRNDTELNGAAKLAAPVIKIEFERLGNKTVEQLRGVLDNLA